MAGVNYTRQYETPIRPENWTGDAGRFYRMLIDVLDDIYLKYGRIDEKMLGSALAQKINSKADNGDVAEIRLEQGRLTASFTSLSGAVTQLTLDVDGLGLAISDSEQRLQTQIDAVPGQITVAVEDVEEGLQAQIDAVPGQITAAVKDAEDGLQAQIDLIPDQITLKVQETVPDEVASALDGYTPTGIVDGSQLIITKDQTHIDTPQFSVNVNGTNGDMTLDENGLAADVITSPSVRPMYTGERTMYVSYSAHDYKKYFPSLTDIFDKLTGKYLPEPVTIEIYYGTTNDIIELSNVDGSSITINGYGVDTYGRILLTDVNSRVTIDNVSLSYRGTTRETGAIDVRNCRNVTITKSRIRNAYSVAGQWVAPIYCESCASVYVEDCALYDGFAAMMAVKNTQACIRDCTGQTVNGYYIARNSTLGILGTAPVYDANGSGVIADYSSRYDGEFASDQGDEDAPELPDEITTVEMPTLNSRTRYGSSWYNSSTTIVSQGVADGTRFRGFMWFDTSKISGRKIKKAAIRLYRQAGIGNSRNIDVYIGAATCSDPSSTSNPTPYNMTSYGKIGVVASKEQLKVTIPVEAVQALADADNPRNCLYVYSESASDYGAFDGHGAERPPVLYAAY